MIKIKSKINKAKVMRRLKKEATDRYTDTWYPLLCTESFMEGAKALLDILKEEE